MKSLGLLCFLALTGAGILTAATQSQSGDELRIAFKDPPLAARPRVWWHWVDGNVTREGIAADLAWMKRVGIGGFQNFDGGFGIPPLIAKPVVFGSPEWKELLGFTAAESSRLGLEMAMAASGGWSETGGPWVKPEEAMKKVVWSETRVTGDGVTRPRLNPPPTRNGPFQDMATEHRAVHVMAPEHYVDIGVYAYRVPAGESTAAAVITSNVAGVDVSLLNDGRFDRSTTLAMPADGRRAWVQYAFAEPRTMRALTVAFDYPNPWSRPTDPEGFVEVSDDGRTFRRLLSLPGNGNGPAYALHREPYTVRTFALPRAKARFYRINFTAPEGRALEDFHQPKATALQVAELALCSEARVDRFEAKAGFEVLYSHEDLPVRQVEVDDAMPAGEMLDLTDRLRADGTLDWAPADGEWTVLRMGYSLTGRMNGPATPASTGYEVDKLNARHVRNYIEKYFSLLSDAVGANQGQHGLQYLLTDSWEVGQENWTDDLPIQFKRLRGYDPTPWLPVLAGRVVGSAGDSERFLWDYRRTLADLLAENHYKLLNDYLRERGLSGLYAEAVGVKQPAVADGLQAKRYVAVPMAEFWEIKEQFLKPPADEFTWAGLQVADVHEAASAAHVYGQNIAAAESFTASVNVPIFESTPAILKPFADRFMAHGVNRFVIHTSVHQPRLDLKPGLTLGPWGQQFTRNETWAELAGPWIAYLSRSSHLLQQGHFGADVAYFYGETGAVVVSGNLDYAPGLPPRYGTDFVSRDAILDLVSVHEGRLVTPSGMSYRLLVLPQNSAELTLALLAKLRDLVRAGAVLLGPKPIGSPSLADDQAAVRVLADELWGRSDPGKSATSFGQGRVYWRGEIEDVLAAENLPPDIDFKFGTADAQIVWLRRHLKEGEIYFVANQKNRSESVDATFRVAGREVEIWRAEDASVQPASFAQGLGTTTVRLELKPYDAAFVVFRGHTTDVSRAVAAPETAELVELTGPWSLQFPPDWGAPVVPQLSPLGSWSASAEAGVRYFSGVGTYTKTIEVPADWLRGSGHLMLDLGTVKEIARVSLNGREVGSAWRAPYRVDISGALRAGSNELRIEVANTWTNRMIGDLQPGTGRKYLFLTRAIPYSVESPLKESGLLGPVRIERVK